MKHEEIWNKVLSQNEEVKYEFSIGKGYRRFGLITLGLLGILGLLVYLPLGILLILFTILYFGWYLEKANAYAFTNKRVLIHKGFFSTNLTSVDYQQITDVKVEEPFLDKIFCETGSISINTAGTGSHEISLEHIETPYEIKKKLDGMREN